MARGYIYEISKKEENLGACTEENFYESLDALGATYVEDVTDQSCQNLLDMLAQHGTAIAKNCFILTNEVKESFFAKRFEDVKSLVDSLTLRDFATSSLYSLKSAIEDEYGDCVYEEGYGLRSFDRFIREAECDVAYYVGNMIYMH